MDRFDLIDGRYGHLRSSGSPGWYPESSFSWSLSWWDEILGSILSPPGIGVELGCGAGDLSLYLAAKGWEMTGFEVSSQAVSWAREKAHASGVGASFHVADLGRSLETELLGQADLVIDADCLHYMIGEQRSIYLRNAHSLLGPSGVFVVRTLVGHPAEELWERLGYDPASQISHMGGVPMTFYAEEHAVLEELKVAGFRVQSSHVVALSEQVPHPCLVAYAVRASCATAI